MNTPPNSERHPCECDLSGCGHQTGEGCSCACHDNFEDEREHDKEPDEIAAESIKSWEDFKKRTPEGLHNSDTPVYWAARRAWFKAGLRCKEAIEEEIRQAYKAEVSKAVEYAREELDNVNADVSLNYIDGWNAALDELKQKLGLEK